MSVLMKAGLGPMASGLLGLGSMLVYLQACRWADWEIVPAQRRGTVLMRCSKLAGARHEAGCR